MSKDFIFNTYFNLYKDTCVISFKKFYCEFIDKNGEYDHLIELHNKIREYQLEKYGNFIVEGRSTYVSDEEYKRRANIIRCSRRYRRWG